MSSRSLSLATIEPLIVSFLVKMVVELKCRMHECQYVEKEGDTMMAAIELMKFHLQAEHGGECRKKMERPMIQEESTDKDWETFVDDWERYKASQNIRGAADVRLELLNCCGKEVRQSLKQSRGTRTGELSEVQLMDRIKKHAVISSHVSVHRKDFNNLRH